MTPKRTRRALPIALALLAILTLLGPVWPGARLSVSTGSVEIGRGEPPVWKLAAAGEALNAGDRVRTGENGRAEVTQGGSVLRLYPNSLLRLPATRQVDMEKGSTLFDVLHDGEPFEVRTPEVVVSVKGTRFGVSLEGDDAAVSVFRGLVGVRGDGGGAPPETLVYAGFAARGHDHFELSWHGGDDPWDGWGHGDRLPAPSRGAALRDARRAAIASAGDLPADAMRERGRGERPKGEHGSSVVEAVPASVADAPLEPGVARDVVADAGDSVDTMLERKYVAGVLNRASDGLLTIQFIDGSGGSGSDRVELLDDLNTWVFEESQLDDILDGEDSLPANLVTVLDQQGINDVALVNQLMALFRK